MAASARPQALYEYATVAEAIDGELTQAANELDPRLSAFLAACTEFNAQVDANAAANLRSHASYAQTNDAWVRDVGREFENADRPTLSDAELERRAHHLYDRFENDGFLWSSSETDLDEIRADLAGLTPADWKRLQEIYNAEYQGDRDNFDLVRDLERELTNPADRYQLTLLLDPARVLPQSYSTTEVGNSPHIKMDIPGDRLMVGSEITYTFNPGLINPGRTPQVRAFAINDAGQAQELGKPEVATGSMDGMSWHARADFPGNHKIVFEVQYEGEPPRYYTYQQLVVKPEDLARQRMQQTPNTSMQAELYLQMLDLQIEQLGLQPQTEENKETLQKLRDARANAAKLLTGETIPLQATLTAQENSQTMNLQLWAKPLGDGRWQIIDLTNPSPDVARTYEGDSFDEAWDDYVDENIMPEGYIALKPPRPEKCFDGLRTYGDDEILTGYSDGEGSFSDWIDGLSVLGIVAGIAGVALMFVPGGQIPGGLILGTLAVGGTAMAVSGGLSIADRVQHGNFQWNSETWLDLFDIAGGLTLVGGAGLNLAKQLTVRQLGNAVLITEAADQASNIGGGIVLLNVYYEQIQLIQRDNSLTPEQKQEKIDAILKSAALAGGLVFLGMRVDLPKNVDVTIDTPRLNQATANLPADLRTRIQNSPTLQQLLHNKGYDPALINDLYKTWNQLGPARTRYSFEDWVGVSMRGLQDVAQIRSTYNAQRPNSSVPGITSGENISFSNFQLTDSNYNPIGNQRQLLGTSRVERANELLPTFNNREFLRPYGAQDPTIFTPTPHQPGQTVRFSDPEFTILENIARQLRPDLANQLNNLPAGQRMNINNQTYPDVYGEIEIFSERRLCNSCDDVVNQFQRMFPNIKVNIVSGPENPRLAR